MHLTQHRQIPKSCSFSYYKLFWKMQEPKAKTVNSSVSKNYCMTLKQYAAHYDFAQFILAAVVYYILLLTFLQNNNNVSFL